MVAPDHLREAVTDLSAAAGIAFEISDTPAAGTQLYVVYARDLSLPDRYTPSSATFGFRVPQNYPDAAPEDSFFLQAPGLRLVSADASRNSTDIHRASWTSEWLRGTPLEREQALVFSWHLWDRSPWNRRKHSLVDHYAHCVRRFEQPEHD